MLVISYEGLDCSVQEGDAFFIQHLGRYQSSGKAEKRADLL
jgi:hypothetical protein